MGGRGDETALIDQVGRAISGFSEVTLHHGFERSELSHRDEVCLGFVEPSGFWLGADEGGEVHPGRFGRPFVRVTSEFGEAIAAAVERSEHGETWAAVPVMQVSSGLYLGLMNADAESLAEVAAALERASDRGSLWRLWEPRNWRPHMLACAAACVTGDPSAADMAWMAFDRTSGAAPHLAVTLQRIDPGFAAAAAGRLDGDDLDGKSRGALAALLDREVAGDDDGARLALDWKRSVERFLAER